MSIKQRIIYIYFLVLPFIDLITSLITRFTDFPISLGMIVKGLTLVFGVIYILFLSKSKYRKVSRIYLFILMLFAVLYFAVKPDIWNIKALFEEVTIAFRYIYFPVMLFGLLNIFDDLKIDNVFIKKILLINCLTHAVLLLIPYFTGTSFDSYGYDMMLGQNGWFYAANEIGTIVILLLFSISYLFDGKKLWKTFLILPILFSIALLGTKVSYFGMIIVVFIVIINLIYKHKFKGILYSAIVVSFLMIACLWSPAINNLKGNISRVEQNSEIVESEEPQVEEDIGDIKEIDEVVKDEKVLKFLKIALNGRANFFYRNYQIYKKSGISNILFGISFSKRKSINYTFDKRLIEIDYLDIFIHYGIFGFIIYFLPILYFIYKILKNIKNMKFYTLSYPVIFILGLLISSFAGHVLSAPAVSIYLVLLMIIINDDIENFKKLKDNEITIMALHLGYGGIEKYISSLCGMLDKKYKINIIATYKLSEKPAFKFSNRVSIKYLINRGPNRKEFKEAVKSKNIFSIIKEGLIAIKILYLKSYRNIKAIMKIDSKYIITTINFHSSLVGTYSNKNIIKIATEHNYHNNDKKYIKKVVNSIIKFDYFVVVSDELKDFYQDKIGSTKCVFIPNVIDKLPDVETKLNENNIINIGRIEYEKGQEDLIDIIKEVKKEINDVKLYIIGDGSLRQSLQTKINENNLQDTIILTGFLSQDKLKEYFIKSKIFVMTSYTESFGLVLIESMSYKVPCIAFDCAHGARELLKDDVGILVPNRDKKLMKDKIVELLTDNKKLKKYSKVCYEECKKYLQSNVKEEWFKILGDI